MAFRSRVAQICRPSIAGPISRPQSSLTSPASQDISAHCRYRTQSTVAGLTTAGQTTQPRQATWNTLPSHRYASTKASAPSGQSEPVLAGAPDITNHYTIFANTLPSGPPPASPFEISLSDLRREFLQLQSLVHPDKYPNGNEKAHAEGLSARINEAYRTLIDPLQRAQYLLRELHGIDVTAEDASTKHALDPETLMEVMEVQETIEEVGASPEGEAQINALKKENDGRVMECVQALAGFFDAGDLEAARKECIRLRFWYSVGEGLREWEPGHTEIRLMHTS
ncbi:uncharacterized protein N7511_003986 [Penicillium nucicola]|uniref:uncharacterized protein n=1 Tax=Penicillium nucicola TaxID=1850975 RepID=UPI00254501BB|nr:uncharacterized protein N7511_003986 [Penicillium nucicola]KAJ5766370.1 hypothetical protein N7511_003986 [Penicillium nucicola]